MELNDVILRRLLAQTYFINGTAYAGKSTMVRLLAERHDGVMCGENYHAALTGLTDPKHQPNLCYFQTMSGWSEFLNRSPQEYVAWMDGCSREAADLELVELIRRTAEGKPVFVDTNLPLSLLHKISDERHVAILLCDRQLSVSHFFDRDDPDKQFLQREIGKTADPETTRKRFEASIALANSPERYREFAESGFAVFVRDDTVTIDDMLTRLERHFRLTKK